MHEKLSAGLVLALLLALFSVGCPQQGDANPGAPPASSESEVAGSTPPQPAPPPSQSLSEVVDELDRLGFFAHDVPAARGAVLGRVAGRESIPLELLFYQAGEESPPRSVDAARLQFEFSGRCYFASGEDLASAGLPDLLVRMWGALKREGVRLQCSFFAKGLLVVDPETGEETFVKRTVLVDTAELEESGPWLAVEDAVEPDGSRYRIRVGEREWLIWDRPLPHRTWEQARLGTERLLNDLLAAAGSDERAYCSDEAVYLLKPRMLELINGCEAITAKIERSSAFDEAEAQLEAEALERLKGQRLGGR